MGLQASSAMTASLAEEEIWQLVANQMAQDPSDRQGPKRIRELIGFNTQQRLTRYVTYAFNICIHTQCT